MAQLWGRWLCWGRDPPRDPLLTKPLKSGEEAEGTQSKLEVNLAKMKLYM